MSKDQKQKKKLNVETVDKLIMANKMINEMRSGLTYWKLDQIWPTNLYYKTLGEVVEIINQVLLSNDFTNEKVWPVYNTKNKPPKSSFKI